MKTLVCLAVACLLAGCDQSDEQQPPTVSQIQSACEKYEPASAEDCQIREMGKFIDRAQESRDKAVDEDLNKQH